MRKYGIFYIVAKNKKNGEVCMSKEEFVKQLKSNGYRAFLSNGTAYVTSIPDNIEKVTASQIQVYDKNTKETIKFNIKLYTKISIYTIFL